MLTQLDAELKQKLNSLLGPDKASLVAKTQRVPFVGDGMLGMDTRAQYSGVPLSDAQYQSLLDLRLSNGIGVRTPERVDGVDRAFADAAKSQGAMIEKSRDFLNPQQVEIFRTQLADDNARLRALLFTTITYAAPRNVPRPQ